MSHYTTHLRKLLPSDEKGFSWLHKLILAWAVIVGFSYDVFPKTVNVGGYSFNFILAITAVITITSTIYLLVRGRYRLLRSKMLLTLSLVAAIAGLSGLIYWSRSYQLLFSAEVSPAVWLIVLLFAWNFANLYDSVKMAAQVIFTLAGSFILGTFLSFAAFYLNVSGRLSFPDLRADSYVILANLTIVAVGFILAGYFLIFDSVRRRNYRLAGYALTLLAIAILGLTLSMNTVALLIFSLGVLAFLFPNVRTIGFSALVAGLILVLSFLAVRTPFIAERWSNLQLQLAADVNTTAAVTQQAISASNPFWGIGPRPFNQTFLQFQPVNNEKVAFPEFGYAFADIWQLVINYGLVIVLPFALFSYYFIKRSYLNLLGHDLWVNKTVFIFSMLAVAGVLFSHVSMQLWAVVAVIIAVCANFEAAHYWRVQGRAVLVKLLAILLSASLIVYLVAYTVVSIAGGIYGEAYSRLNINDTASQQYTLDRIEAASRLDSLQPVYHRDLAKLYASILVDNLNQRTKPATMEELAVPLNTIWQEATAAVESDQLDYLNWDTRLSVLDLSSKLAPKATDYSPLFNEAISHLRGLAPHDPTKMLLLAQFVKAYNNKLALDIAKDAYMANPNIPALQIDYAKFLISISDKADAQKVLQTFLNGDNLPVDVRDQANDLLNTITQ